VNLQGARPIGAGVFAFGCFDLSARLAHICIFERRFLCIAALQQNAWDAAVLGVE
jgi:hypothetical protein